MDLSAGWQLDASGLREVLTDRAAAERELAESAGVARLRYLRLLGRLDEAQQTVRELLAAKPADPWPLLLAAAEVYADTGHEQAADRLLAAAWRHARSRERQASTLQTAAAADVEAGELDNAAAKLALVVVLRRGFAALDVSRQSEDALGRLRASLATDAVIVAGGRGARLGGRDKPGQKLAGWPLIDHVLLAAAGAGRRIVVGPARRVLTESVFCHEDPPGAGPVAALAAGLAKVEAPLVAVLAADLPFIGPALGQLRRALADSDADAAVLVDTTGRSNHLAALWRTASLRAAVGALGELTDRPVRALYDGAEVVRVPDFEAAGADCDTWDDLRLAAERLTRRSPERLAATPLAWPRLELYSPS